jgi:hypothetical protein
MVFFADETSRPVGTSGVSFCGWYNLESASKKKGCYNYYIY